MLCRGKTYEYAADVLIVNSPKSAISVESTSDRKKKREDQSGNWEVEGQHYTIEQVNESFYGNKDFNTGSPQQCPFSYKPY